MKIFLLFLMFLFPFDVFALSSFQTNKNSPILSPNTQIMKRQRKGKRLIPLCRDEINPNKILKLKKYVVQITILKDKLNIYRKIYLIPTPAWEKKCDHLFLLGFPLTIDIPAGKKSNVTFSILPNQNFKRKPRIFSFIPSGLSKKSVSTIGYIGTKCMIRPFKSSVTDQMIALEVNQYDLPLNLPKEKNKTDIIEHNFTIPLSHLNQWIADEDLEISIMIDFQAPWIFTGASLPEDNIVANRIGWNLTKIPKRDLTVLISNKEPIGGQGDDIKNKSKTYNLKIILLFVFLITILLGLIVFFLHRRKNQNTN